MTPEKKADAFLEKYNSVDSSKKFNLLQEHFRALKDEPDGAARQALLEARIFGNVGSYGTRKKIVILIHGIRTQARWFSTLASMIEENDNFSTEEIKYGFVNALQFVLPHKFFRKKIIEGCLSNINDILGRNRDRDVLIVAHSFGTYIITDILERHPHILVDKMIFSGSVVLEHYRWDKISNVPAKMLLNECAVNDVWPVMAKIVSCSFGASGRFGFAMARVRNRYHFGGHSGFLSREFFGKYWVPFLHEGTVDRTDADIERPEESWFIQVAAQLIRVPYLLFAITTGACYLILFAG